MNRYFDDVIKQKPLLFFVFLLASFNIVLMAMYFSGSSFLQNIIVPQMVGLDENSWREFGLLEMLQNLFLIGLIFIFIYALIVKDNWVDKGLYFIAISVFVFLFLEEIDYGLHYYEWVTGEVVNDGPRNWHNQVAEDGHQNTRKIKRIADALMIIIFVLLPLINLIKPVNKVLGRYVFVPVIYFVGAAVLALAFSKLAHYFEDAGFAMINGIEGKMHNNISEFRETSIYYIYLLYALQLVGRNKLLSRH